MSQAKTRRAELGDVLHVCAPRSVSFSWWDSGVESCLSSRASAEGLDDNGGIMSCDLLS